MAEWAWSGWALSFQAANPQSTNRADPNNRELRRHDELDPSEDPSRPDNARRVLELEWPLFTSPTLNFIQVSGYEMYNNSLYYIVSIEMGGNFRWSVLKSYEEFAHLHRILMDAYGLEKNLFPHRKMFGSHKLDNVKDMQARLNQYLISVLKYFMVPPVQILQFLEYTFSDVLSITQTLSALFYDKGEEFLSTNRMVAFSPVQLHCVCQRLVLPIEFDLHDVKEDFGHLLDFLQQLRKIKICKSSRKHFKLASDVSLKFDLSIMKSLDTLVLKRIDLNLLEGFGVLPQSLSTLAVHGGLNAMRDILKHPCLIKYESEGGMAQHCSWPSLKVIDFSDNDIVAIDSSLELAPNLESLNLRNNAVKDIDNLSNLPHLRMLELTSNRIESLRGLHRRLGNITTLCLAKNSLISLQGLEKCYSIVCLDIQNNRLKKVSDLAPLTSLPLLEQLMLRGNPFTETPFYRQKVFGQLFNTAAQLAVDGKPPSKDELKVSESMAIKESNMKIQKSRKVTTRKASIKLEDEEEREVIVSRQQDNQPMSVGTRRNMEEMRKEGGDDWLTLLNKTQPETSPVVIHKKRKPKKSSKKRVKPHTTANLSSSGGDIESSSEYKQPSSMTGSSTGLPSPHLIQLLGTRKCSSTPWNCNVSVMETNEKLPMLSHQEMEDIFVTLSMDQCIIIVDIGLGRITEDYVLPGTVGKNRNTRDLTFLRCVRVHEGTVLAIAIELSTIVTASSWIIYTLKDYPSLADMYLLLSRKLKLVDDIKVPSPVMLAKQMSIPNSNGIESDPDDSPSDMTDVPSEERRFVSSGEQHQEIQVIGEEQDNEASKSTLLEQNMEHIHVSISSKEGNAPEIPNEADNVEHLVTESLKCRRMTYSEPLIKPGIGNEEFQKFLMKKVVCDSSEVVLHVVWCGLCLPGTVPYQVEGAVVISNDGIYLLEVKGHQNWEWDRKPEDFPLFPVAAMKLEHLSRVTEIGMFNLNLFIEVHQGRPITSFVVFMHNSDECSQLVAHMKVVLEASNLDYRVMDAFEAKKMRKSSGVVFISPDHYTGGRLKEWLSRDRSNVRLANFISTQMDRSVVGMYEVELQRSCRELARSFDIEQYLMVMSVDPSTNCKLQSLVLVATNTDIMLFEEAFISGPGLRFTPIKHSFPPLSIIDHEKIASIKAITFTKSPHFVHSPTDPMYQVMIQFDGHIAVPWYFCTRDFETLTSTLKYIQQQWNTILSNNTSFITTMSSPLPYFNNLVNISSYSPQHEHSHKSGVPRLIKSKALVRFGFLPYWQKQVVFNEHISQANYLKQDETIVYSELVHCVPLMDRKQEVEVCIIVSNYAIYAISDKSSIVQWLDAGGVSSFSRMSLMNPESDYPLQCFYCMWLSDLRKIEVDHFNLSFSLQEMRPKVGIDVVTSNAQVTASFITALASKVKVFDNHLKEDKGEILQDFIDIAADPFGEELENIEVGPPSPGTVRPSVDLTIVGDKDLSKLKLHLVESQTEVARGSSVSKCSESMQIICTQIMLLAEQFRVRESLLFHYYPHLVFLTNYGLFICRNDSLPSNTPCLLLSSPSSLKVKKWLRINDILSVQLTTDTVHNVPQIAIAMKPPGKASEGHSQMCLYPLLRTQGSILINQLKLIWAERTGITGHTLQIHSS